MVKEKIIESLSSLGKYIQDKCKFTHIIEQAIIANPWFDKKFIYNALDGISYMLNEQSLYNWAKKYSFNKHRAKNIALLLPGNIPAVGFHDILCTLLSNNRANIKLSSSDNIIIPFLLDTLVQIDNDFKNSFCYVEKFTDIDALIATGRSETVKYFKEYFKNIPKIIRKHMTSIAILSGKETSSEISNLANDIFLYYGLGCRNISKIYTPINYFSQHKNDFFIAMDRYRGICERNTKYMNNYTYNKALYMLNKILFIDNGFITIIKNDNLTSRLANLNYQEYENISDLKYIIQKEHNNLQCVAAGTNLAIYNITNIVPFGKCQKPDIDTYADGIDTMDFLTKLDSIEKQG